MAGHLLSCHRMSPWWRPSGNIAAIAIDCGASALARRAAFVFGGVKLDDRQSRSGTRAARIDAVVIGRNEGARLTECLQSLQGRVRTIVYVDSGSTDGSLENAKALGAVTVVLDRSIPFTAARARNAGAEILKQDPPAFVQFVDGDCALDGDWIGNACRFLQDNPQVAVVCGRRRERFPERSVFNRLCDREWDTPVGDAKSCGGDAMMQFDAFEAVGGFNDTLIAGEEPELCVRLRKAGWKIWRLDAEMSLHDAAMTRFSQWARRTMRAGHAFAEGAALHGAAPERHWVKETARAVFWGAALPAVILALASWNWLWAGLLLVYPIQILRISLRAGLTRQGVEVAVFSVLGKPFEAFGAFSYWIARLRGKRRQLIEYK